MQNSEEFYKLYDFQKFGGHSKSLGLCPQTYSFFNNRKKKKVTLQWSVGGCLVKGFGKGNACSACGIHMVSFHPLASCSNVGD